MRHGFEEYDEEQLRMALEDLANQSGSLADTELLLMSRIATSASERTEMGSTRASTKRSRYRVPAIVAVLVGMVVLGPPLLAAVMSALDQTAARTGVQENPPSPPVANYTPAPIPYVSVQPLMRYIDSTVPVVPLAAVTERNGQRVVFVVTNRNYYGEYAEFPVRAQVVEVGATYGKAVAIISGLTPCDVVVVDPPQSLKDGDLIPSYITENSADAPSIDFTTLFEGLPPAPTPAIGGGIAYQDGTDVVVFIFYQGIAPDGATYLYIAPDGSSQAGAYESSGVEVRVPASVLALNRPVGNVQLLSPAGRVLGQGDLDWYCDATGR